jgi:hypothetical protein
MSYPVHPFCVLKLSGVFIPAASANSPKVRPDRALALSMRTSIDAGASLGGVNVVMVEVYFLSYK